MTLRQLAEVAHDRVPDDVAARIDAAVERSGGRMAHGSTRTVAALAGATGSGKSSLFNAIAGAELAATGVRRPTTSTTSAAVFSSAGTLDADASGLLDWLEVHRRHVVTSSELDGLILLDLPDHDSTDAAHRAEVDRLVDVVDFFVWVVDPQKYADAALHRDYLQRFAGHSDVTIVVLNQLDTLAAADRQRALDDLIRLVRADGLTTAAQQGAWREMLGALTGRDGGVRALGTSARTGDGVAELRGELAARAAERRAMVTRIEADLDWIASDVGAVVGDRAPGTVPQRAVGELGAALADAVGADGIGAAVASSHQRAGRAAVGWPPTRWVVRLRPDPLRRLGLSRSKPGGGPAAEPARVDRTSLPPMTPVAAAGVSSAIRRVASSASEGLPEGWGRRVADAAASRRDDLDDALDRAVATADLPTSSPSWWRGVGLLQWILAAAMLAGLLWLLADGVVDWLGLPELPHREVASLPLQTVLAIGGALAGVLVGAVARRANAAAARRRASQTRGALAKSASGVADELVIAPINAELQALARVRALAHALRR